MIILHIAKRKDWEDGLEKGEYSPRSLSFEGFIHCSTAEQIINIANANFKNEKGLVLLCIDSSKVKAEIHFEKGGREYYPHIYGPLNLDAVVKTCEFEPGLDGNFSLPAGVEELVRLFK
ncbi:protein of unknown function DUF952 [Thermoanaerobacter mathranii subsp. mathranii str. A3]|jgi:uncharacterized protein (DUF952 family)|uniref:Glutathione S-transferase domain protein n=3 Tax=Thermoanaerobacter TaxID=1754 RepID=D3T7P2_THEIA|nr:MULTISPECIES: DUF952 domain-containing protein [Thermoanaerobacter]ADD01974.1 protein of unknown function DUF952 [Thermoanaerobacter italicus Ab9]ADH60477.1 protein of unknown function DUF952 [Thermoanaerobacter mathranii subsp. mathranii str. A3]MBT1279468.1 DUF952 domain-containing protein [Thermoanaerobacter sp. CM-CNRG TB177]MDP9750051.1 uncharacterized protein (DUF952 family) [Thermoanaerobacter pentosaceus]